MVDDLLFGYRKLPKKKKKYIFTNQTVILKLRNRIYVVNSIVMSVINVVVVPVGDILFSIRSGFGGKTKEKSTNDSAKNHQRLV